MQGRGHLLRGRKKSWENNDVEESKAIPPTQQSPTSTAGSGRFFPSETKSEANITVSRPHSSFVARSKSDTPSLKSHKQLQQGRPRPISDQFPQTNAASRPTRVDGFGEHHNRSDAQRQMMPQGQARSSYVGNAYEEDVVFLRDNVSPSRSMNRESQESRGNPRIIPDVPYQDSQRERTKGDDQMNSSRTLKPAMLSTERYERGKEKWYRPPSGLMNEGERPRDGWYRPPPRPAYEDEAPREEWYGPNPGLTNEIWRNWDFGDAQKAQASSSQQRPASQIVSPRSSKYSEEPQRSMDEGQRIPRPSAQQVYQDSEPTDRLYQSQYTRGVSSSAYQPMPSQRRSTDSNESEASGLSEVDGQHYRRDAEDEEYYGLRQMRRSKTDHFGYDSRPNEVKGQQPVLRRHTGFGNQELGGREERGPRREYVTDEGRPSSDSVRRVFHYLCSLLTSELGKRFSMESSSTLGRPRFTIRLLRLSRLYNEVRFRLRELELGVGRRSSSCQGAYKAIGIC